MPDEALFLRRLRQSDAPAVQQAFASNPDMARQGVVTTTGEASAYVARLVDPGSPHEPWAVVESNALIGLVCITVDGDNRNGWFWYWMTDRARGRGVMSRAAATVAEWALEERGLERLELGHRVNNPASGVVARRAGFVKEGTQREKFLVDGQRLDVDTYGRLKTDPRPAFHALPLILVER
ncbi:GNAT family N-acetyltransferase [Kocuria rhizophila]|uniref:GNAT family N-acetyltransferase n=1 Tax=Kocuria rhizophila TaxID=72000 RepID=UPI0007501EA7|nr:GNAT family protein [Kocuria rhizophila]KUP28169.1 GNAT family acetyltransferase [Kocuria rhizophila]